MKKASLVNLAIIVGLLVLCVMTLVAVYATAPEASVLLLEEGFGGLDESKWTHKEAYCKEDGGQFHYVTADEENRLIVDGVLHIYPNITSVHFRTKREPSKKCYTCLSWENSTGDCNPLLFSTKFQTKEAFQASRGRVEIRARICCGGQIQLDVGLTRHHNSSSSEEIFENVAEPIRNQNSSEIRILFESNSSNKTVITSGIADGEFHTYEIEWDEEKVEFNIDRKKVAEKRLEEREAAAAEEENISNGTVKLDSGPISKPFYLTVGVGLGEKALEAIEDHSNSKRSLENSTEVGLTDSGVLEVDHIRIYKILK